MKDDFFVGYLVTPARDQRFLKRLMVGLIVFALGAGALIASKQKNPGPGMWELDQEVSLSGLLFLQPYTHLRVMNDGSVKTVFLVGEVKFDVSSFTQDLDAHAVQVTGFPLKREGRYMLSVSEGGIHMISDTDVPSSKLEAWKRRAVGPVVLQGELIDSKCYLGAMKPGSGKAHKACAQLCVEGGIPPMFVSRAPNGKESLYLVVSPEGETAKEIVKPYLGDPVQLTATYERWNDLHVLRISKIENL